MKTLIIYESAHHSNTFKLVDEDMVKDMNGEYDFRYAREARHGKIGLFTMIFITFADENLRKYVTI